MARRRRRDVIDESVVGAFHVGSRTVRRTFLTGVAPQTGQDYSYRKAQIEPRPETLAGIFAIDVLDHAVLELLEEPTAEQIAEFLQDAQRGLASDSRRSANSWLT